MVSLTEDFGEQELLRLAAIAESGSEHPLAQAVIRKDKENDTPITNHDSFEAISDMALRPHIQIIQL